jgi:cobalt/nickel transport system permease protein
MHANAYDRYQAGHSFLHLLDPRVKVIVALGFIVSNVLVPDGAWVAFLLAWIALLIANLFSGLGAAFSLKRSYIALPFALVAVTTLFSIQGQTIASFSVGFTQIEITDAGLLRFVSILIRSWLSVQIAILLVAVTQFPDLMHAFRHLKAPAVIVAVISFTYRYLFVLVDEALRLLRAREARSALAQGARSGGSLLWRARVTGNMVGQLFLRSYERSDRIYNAMLSRGYRGHLHTLNPHEMRQGDWAAAALGLAALLVIQILGRI